MAYKPRKIGVYDTKITNDKGTGRPAPDAFGYLYGSRQYRKVFLEAMEVRRSLPIHASGAHSFTDRGDFTHLSGRGL
ncbi:hypothetical protein [Pseudomonas phage PCS4]|uniref:Uncharacterized protein n=1 Tax=Pseudomonas phage PCS4 TaxID=2875705 RepID=A0ABY3P983_9CAUD|nr:hypothetical protein [Pseudomonas phage PCS4]UPW35201.1 hypothetical protein [Pseudomonas phage PCS5]UZZ63868.1 hypothetical protein PSV6_8 [Pseudomonas phage PSV6]WCD55460.1 hypothetical protein CCNLGMII_00006 [Pseudomonas phage phi C106]